MVWASDEERERTEAVKVFMKMNVAKKRERRRAKKRRLDIIENDIMRANGVCLCVRVRVCVCRKCGSLRQMWRSRTRMVDPK